MSAPNYTQIQLYRTSTASAQPLAVNLADGELAINTTDEKLYFKNAGGTVKLLASSAGASGSVTSVDVSGGTTGLTFSGGPVISSGTITMAGTLDADNGGTGQSSYTVGDILYASGTTTLSKLADVATGNALISGGVGVAPSWGKIGLTTHVSGTLPVANGGTGTTTAFTTGSVVFAGASGVYSQDNANLFWDDTNNRLGIGTTTPAYGISVDGNVLSQRQYAAVGNLILQRADGTKGSPTAVADAATVGGPTGQAYDGTDYRTIGAVRFVTNGATSGTNYGGDIIFVTGDPGAATSSTKMRLNGYGNLGLGVTPSAWGSFYKAIESTSSSEFAITSQQNGVEFGRGYYKINSGFASIATTTQATSKYAQDGSGVHAWYYGAATTIGGTISFTQAMTLSAAGGLSVGTTTDAGAGKILAAKGILPRVNATTSTTSPWAWNSDNYDQQSFSALANALTINADAGTPTDGQKTILRFKDNATPRVLTFTGGASKAFRDMTGLLTVSGSNFTYTTTASKTVYFGCVYNNDDSRWDIVAVTAQP